MMSTEATDSSNRLYFRCLEQLAEKKIELELSEQPNSITSTALRYLVELGHFMLNSALNYFYPDYHAFYEKRKLSFLHISTEQFQSNDPLSSKIQVKKF